MFEPRYSSDHALHHVAHRKPDLAHRFVAQTRGGQTAKHHTEMLGFEFTAPQFSDAGKDRSSKQVLRLLSRALAPVAVFVLLRNVHLFNEPSYRFGSQHMRWIPV
jgi:hypothetical protein